MQMCCSDHSQNNNSFSNVKPFFYPIYVIVYIDLLMFITLALRFTINKNDKPLLNVESLLTWNALPFQLQLYCNSFICFF